MDVPITEEVFRKHLGHKRQHNDFAENGDTLMSKLADQEILKTRGRTHGFVIPTLDAATYKEVLKLLCSRKWTAKINSQARIKHNGETFTYAYIELSS